MDTALLLAVIAVVCAWAVLVLAIQHWGPGHARRWVRCPKWGGAARVAVEQREGEFGSLRVTDILACSLFPDRPLNCAKECLHRF